ncbi:MAG: Mur ligase domain-containing protein [Candidatus Nomurabacteria bacterium]
MKLTDYKNIHCIGIGGIGLSALARYCHANGSSVSGSDGVTSDIIEKLKQEGLDIFIGQSASNIKDNIDLVIYTIAISDDNAELVEARNRGIKCMTYPEALGLLTKEYTTISVCGTHGKTTTTAMTYYALKACGINPTIIIGSLLSDGGTNFIAGDSKYLVVESCEYRRSFLNLNPRHIIVTNIDADHLDYYKDIEDIHEAFQSFAYKLDEEGFLVTHSNVSLNTKAKKIDADCIDRKSIELSVLGEHNQSNAQLVCALLEELGLDEEKIREGLKNFPGTWRRLEYKGKTENGVVVYDDYGHHPNEIKATLEAIREKYSKEDYKLHVFFQPHLHSRTKAFFEEFGDVLKEADFVSLMPIYKARLETDLSVSSEDLRDSIIKKGGHAETLVSVTDLPESVMSIVDSNTIVLNIGAGDAFAELNKIPLKK